MDHRTQLYANGQTKKKYVKIWQCFKDVVRLPSWICGAYFGITHKKYLEKFITGQNSGGSVNTLCAWLGNAYSRPQNKFSFRVIDPLNEKQH